MSVYSELVRVGINQEAAKELQESVARNQNAVTKYDLDLAVTKLEKLIIESVGNSEKNLYRAMITTMIGMTAIFAVFVAAMTAVVGWMVSR